MLELQTKKKLQYKLENPFERFMIFLDPFMILIYNWLPTVIATSSKEIQAILERKMILDTPRHHKVVNIFI